MLRRISCEKYFSIKNIKEIEERVLVPFLKTTETNIYHDVIPTVKSILFLFCASCQLEFVDSNTMIWIKINKFMYISVLFEYIHVHILIFYFTYYFRAVLLSCMSWICFLFHIDIRDHCVLWSGKKGVNKLSFMRYERGFCELDEYLTWSCVLSYVLWV